MLLHSHANRHILVHCPLITHIGLLSALFSFIYYMYRGYSMVWRWIWNLFHEWDRIFYITSAKQVWEYGIILSHKWNIKFHIQHQKHWYMAQILLMQRKTLFNQSIDQKHWMFFLLHFLWFLTCFFQIFDNAWCDITVTCYFTLWK